MTALNIPTAFVPMAPALSRPPLHRDGWVYQEKVDGWRMLAYKDGPRVRLISANGVEDASRFRERPSPAGQTSSF